MEKINYSRDYMKRKGQAAMEYLMTYGWAILIIIVVVGALFAMGVFKTEGAVACSPCFSKFAFVDYTSNNGNLLIRNGPQDINITGVSGVSMPTQTDYNPGEDVQLTVTDTTSATTTVQITYDVVGGLTGHTDSATIHN
jgi:uncharacterized protein (UPF0333 family)